MIELASSIVSSTVSTCIVYPAERIKLQMHLHPQIKTTKEAIAKIYNEHSIAGFYAGLSSQLVGNGISYAIYFVAYAKAKKAFEFDPDNLSSMIKSAGTAGCISAICTNPFWVLKTKQAQQNISFFAAAKELIQSEGVLSLWKGQLASLILVSNPIIQFCIYEWLKKKLRISQNNPFYDLAIFLIGAISKIIATVITYPYTLIRTKQHISKDKSKSMYQTFVSEIQKNGVAGLYTGLDAKIVQSVLNSAIMLMVYERTKLTLEGLVSKMATK